MGHVTRSAVEASPLNRLDSSSLLQQDFHSEKKDPKRNTMIYPLLLTFLLQQTSAECPKSKTVGDTCYTLEEYTDTSDYGCYEGCIYKKTEDDGSNERYCFKIGSLPVSESQCDGPSVPTDQAVAICNTSPFDVTVTSTCYNSKELIRPGDVWTRSCDIVTIYGYHMVNGTQKNCRPLKSPREFHPKFVIIPDNTQPGGCRITLPIDTETGNTISPMTTSPPINQNNGIFKVNNTFNFAVEVKVYNQVDLNVTIPSGQCKIREIVVSEITGYFNNANGKRQEVTYPYGPQIPATYHPEFFIYGIGGGDCKIGLPTYTTT